MKTKRWIHEGNIQRLSRAGKQPVQRIGFHYSDLIRLEREQDIAKITRGHIELLNQDDFCGTPRCGLQAERPAAGKQIHAHSAANMRLQPVKQGFTNTVT